MTNSSTGTRWNGLMRSAFKRKPLPLARQVAWQARTPLKAVSDKRRKENAERRKVLAEMRRENPLCARCKAVPWVDGHELKRRSGAGSITDKENIIGLCRPCHEWVGMNPVQAIKDGFAVSRFT